MLNRFVLVFVVSASNLIGLSVRENIFWQKLGQGKYRECGKLGSELIKENGGYAVLSAICFYAGNDLKSFEIMKARQSQFSTPLFDVENLIDSGRIPISNNSLFWYIKGAVRVYLQKSPDSFAVKCFSNSIAEGDFDLSLLALSSAYNSQSKATEAKEVCEILINKKSLVSFALESRSFANFILGDIPSARMDILESILQSSEVSWDAFSIFLKCFSRDLENKMFKLEAGAARFPDFSEDESVYMEVANYFYLNQYKLCQLGEKFVSLNRPTNALRMVESVKSSNFSLCGFVFASANLCLGDTNNFLALGPKLINDNNLDYFKKIFISQKFLQNDRLEEGIIFLNKILPSVDPIDIDSMAHCYNQLGYCHGVLSNYFQSEECFLKVLELRPNWATGKRNMAMLYSVQGKSSDAIYWLEEARLNTWDIDELNEINLSIEAEKKKMRIF